ncbi:MAG: citrate synthase [Bacteroidota bacterium]
MNETATLQAGDKQAEIPVVVGTYDEKGMVISTLRGETGYVTLDVGFKNTGSTQSTITYIDGANGVLEHRGYRIEDLAEKSSFLEVCHLLLHGDLPNQDQLSDFQAKIAAETGLPAHATQLLDALPDETHPMGMLSVLLNAMTGFYPGTLDSWSDEEVRWKSIYRALANMPVMAAYIYRRKTGQAYIAPDPSLGYIENFLNMTFGKVDAKIAEAFDTLLILHADHEQNCSASTVRFVGSSHVNLFAALAAGNNALWGPLHGGANQAVLEMLESIRQDGGDTDRYLAKAKDKADPFRLMGFGHRVYKNYDPRAKVIKKYVDEVLELLNLEDDVVDIAKGLEKAALADEYFSKRKLFPNVDFYSGIIYRALGIPVDMFTVMFALGRMPGWVSQWKEMREGNEPIGRPRQIYVGPTTREYVPLEQR